METEMVDLPTCPTSELMGFLDSPNDTYTAMEAENIVIHMESMLAMENGQTFQSRT